MKCKIIFVATSLIFLSLFVRSQDKKTCQTIDYYVQSTLTAIQTLDTNGYLQLASYDTMLAVVKIGAITDTTQKQIYIQLKDNPDLFKSIFRKNFDRLIKTIRKELQTNLWTIKFKNYKITNTEKDNSTDHLSIQVNIDANKVPYHISLYVTKYNNCYYLFEPVDYYFTKD